MANDIVKLPDRVRRYRVPAALLADSAEVLRRTGAGAREAVALWQGKASGPDSAEVTRLVVPKQVTGPLHFNVPLEERLRIADEASRIGELIVAQLHTHPREAFHSKADDELAIIKHLGAVSIVVPHFGLHWKGSLAEASVHMHLGRSRWRQLEPQEVVSLFEVTA